MREEEEDGGCGTGAGRGENWDSTGCLRTKRPGNKRVRELSFLSRNLIEEMECKQDGPLGELEDGRVELAVRLAKTYGVRVGDARISAKTDD